MFLLEQMFIEMLWLEQKETKWFFYEQLNEYLSDLCQMKTGVNFTELKNLLRGKSWKKINVLSYHGKNKTHHLTMVYSKVVDLIWH